MANKFEEEIVDGTPVQEILNPLDEAVNEKIYSKPNLNTSLDDLSKPIEEPKFTPPPFKKSAPPTMPSMEQESFTRKEPVNPEMRSLPKKEVKMASKQAAALILKGYDWLHLFANKGLLVSERKLNKLQANGEINLNAEIDYDYGKKMRAGEFFQEYNKSVEGLLQVSEEFKEEVTPVLERVLEKKGIGLTDEQTLMFMFSQDIAVKSILFFQQKSQLNYMIQSIKEATANQQMPPPPPPRPRPQYQEPQPQPQPQAQPQPQEPQEVETEEVEDFSPTFQEPEEKDYEVPVKRRGRPKKEI